MTRLLVIAVAAIILAAAVMVVDTTVGGSARRADRCADAGGVYLVREERCVQELAP